MEQLESQQFLNRLTTFLKDEGIIMVVDRVAGKTKNIARKYDLIDEVGRKAFTVTIQKRTL